MAALGGAGAADASEEPPLEYGPTGDDTITVGDTYPPCRAPADTGPSWL